MLLVRLRSAEDGALGAGLDGGGVSRSIDDLDAFND